MKNPIMIIVKMARILPKVKNFKFEVHASKEIVVEGFTNKEMARQWLINNLEDECYDIVNPSTYVSDGDEVK